MKQLTPSMEDYLKVIYKLHRLDNDGRIHISDVAVGMGLKKASVCRATDVLAEKGLLKKYRYKCLYFTDKGLRQALYIERRYSVIMRFLHEVLRVDLDTAQRDACGVEHVISDECYQAICAFMQARMDQ